MAPTDPRPTKAQRRDDARARALELRKQQERAARRNRLIVLSVVGLAVVGLIAAVVIVLTQSKNNAAASADVPFGDGSQSVQPPKIADVTAPSTANTGGGIPVSAKGVGVAGQGDTTLSIYFDLQCPGCQQFDSVNSADLKALAAEPGITVIYQPLSFLDSQSKGTFYSTRAGNALMVVADRAPAQFQDFVTALYANQPKENTNGRTDEQIATVATGVGVPADVIAHFTDTVDGTYTKVGSTTTLNGTWRTFAPFLSAATDHATEVLTGMGLTGITTPTVVLDGKVVGGQGASDAGFFYTAGALAERVRAAAAAKG